MKQPGNLTAAICMLSALLGAPLGAGAATQQKPGLWNNTVKVNLGAQMPQLPPGMIEQMKAAGLQIPFVEPVTQQVCLTPEQVAATVVPDMNDPDSGCSTRNVHREGDRVRGDIQCAGRLKGQGSLEMSLLGPERYAGVTRFEGMSEEGMPVSMTTEFSGQWLSADCGDVAPLAQ